MRFLQCASLLTVSDIFGYFCIHEYIITVLRKLCEKTSVSIRLLKC